MLAQQIVNGVVVGATYALFALGFTLMFGVLRVVNLTYGFYFSAGAFIALYFMTTGGLSVWVALPAAALTVGALSVVLDQLLLTRSRRTDASEMSSLMITLGATLLLYSLATAWLGADIRRMPAGLLGVASGFGGVRFTGIQIVILGTSALIVWGLFALLRWTKLGIAIRALAENSDAATLMGINTRLTFAIVSFVSGLLGATAGVLVGMNYNGVQPYMGETMILKGFAVIILGGLGDVRGAVVAGVFVGLLETLVAAYAASSLREAVAFLALVLVLWVRPSGLFGVSEARRA